MKQRIVFFHLLNNFTGSPLILSNIIEVAIEEGYEVDVYSSSGMGFLSEIKGVNYLHNYYNRANNRSITFFSFFLSQFVLAFHLIFKYRKSNSIFYVNTILPFGSILVGKILGLKVITHVHEFEIQPKSLNNFLFGIVCKYSSMIVAVSEFLKDNPFLRNCEVFVIPNCVSSSFEKRAMVRRNTPNSTLNLLMLASLRPYKGIKEFIELSNSLPQFKFTLVVSESQKEVEDFGSRQSLPKNLTIHAVQRDVHSFYQDADVILNLTKPKQTIESFGMTVLEGMHYGLPAIVPTVGGITELVEDGKNGFRIDSDNLPKIKETILELAKNPNEWNRLHQNSLIHREKFSRTTFRERLISVIGKISSSEERKDNGKKKIVVINATTDLYGANRILALALQAFPEVSNLQLFLPRLEGPLVDLIKTKFPSIELVEHTSMPIIQRKMFSVSGGFQAIKLIVGFYKFLKTENEKSPIDLLYINTLSNFLVLPIASKLKIKTIIHVHEILESPKIVTDFINRYTFKLADSILAVSDAVKRNLIKNNPQMDGTKIKVIHNGIPDVFNLESTLAEKEYCIITLISRIIPEKGIWYFLEAFRLLKNRSRVKVRIIGGSAPFGEKHVEKLKRDIAKSEDNIEYIPFISNVAKFLNETDILVVPSLIKDSFPTTVLEGMCCGKAVVATDTGGAAEAIVDGVSGILIKNNDPRQFADVLETLIGDPLYRKDLGNKARKRYLENFTLARYHDEIAKFLEMVLFRT